MRLAAAAEDSANQLFADSTIPSALTITAIKFLREADGTIGVVGEVQNVTGSTVTFGKVTVNFFAGSTFRGSEYTYIFAPQNVRLTATGAFTEALPPSAVGFFRMFTNISYSSVTSYSSVNEASTFAFTSSTGQLSLQSVAVAANGIGGTDVAG